MTTTLEKTIQTQEKSKTTIAVAYGDGIGPEIMEASLRILEAADAQLELKEIRLGEQLYNQGYSAGIEPSAWDSLRETGVLYKAPITTPRGGGYKSLNVTLRKSLGLFANVRPCISYAPIIETKHPNMDLVIIRENEEDLYAGIEHRQTQEVYQCLKLITRPGSERIIRYAFDYARANNRRKVTCMVKDNIMKLTDGLFAQVFEEIAADYPEIETEQMIIDIATARLADTPEQFDVIVTTNLYGDIVSDVAAQLTGSVGLAGSANIGETVSMFEAIHGSAPDIAGKGMANPSGLLLAGVQMLNHLGQSQVAERVHNAWLKTLEDGIHTGDIYSTESMEKVDTQAFTNAVIARLGQRPEHLEAVEYHATETISISQTQKHKAQKTLVGVDVFVDWDEANRDPDVLGEKLERAQETFKLEMITNRGVKVYPNGLPETFCTDHWRCRFSADAPTHQAIARLLMRLSDAGLDFIKTEHLYEFDGKPAYSLGQGQ